MTGETKNCPLCGEEILSVAIKCKHCGSMLDGDSTTLAPESILADVAANLFRGVETVGGRLKITNHRVVFESHVINLQQIPLEIPLTDIAFVGQRNTMGVVPNGMLLRTKGGVEYKFVVNGRNRLINLIQQQLPRPA